MKKSIALLAALLVAMTIAGGSTYTLHAAPLAEHGGIHLSIADSTTGLPDAEGPPGGQVTMRVAATGTQNMAGLTFRIEYDETVVTVPDGGVTASEDLPDGALFVSNVNNTDGFVSIALVGFSQTGTIFPASMDIADIVFDLNPSGAGQSTPLTFTNEDAFDGNLGNPQPIPVESADGSITIQNVFDILGVVTLQLRTPATQGGIGFSKASVRAVGTGFDTTVQAAPDGSFVIPNVPNGTYTVTADAPGYLSARRQNVVVENADVTLPTKQLLAGDTDDSGSILGADISRVVAAFFQTTVDCKNTAGFVVDFDCSGRVLGNDISVAVSNFGKFQNQPW
jgi:hypothetical protein